jgi:hypothetical protein
MTRAEPDLTGFDPSAWRGRAVNERMRRRLRDSLNYILEQADGAVEFPPQEFDGFLSRLERGPVSPLVFGAYCDLVLALDEDDLGTAERLLREIAAAPNMEDGPRIIDLSDPEQDASSDRYCRFVDTDPETPITILPPGEPAAHLRNLITQAFALIDTGNPALAGEIRAILREIVLAHGTEDAKGLKFDGVSSFMLWGGVVLNVTGYKTAIEVVQALAHESGHNLLFGLCAYGPLQENDDSERYPSPLRIDERPMDGIVHAAYVTARMHQSIQRLIDAGVLDEAQQNEAKHANDANVRNFASGMETIGRHARLTPLGQTVMAGARDYMRAYS